VTTPDELISGAMVMNHIAALRDRVGPHRYSALVATLKQEDQDQLLIVTPLSWVEIATLERLYGAVAPPLDTTVEALHIEIATQVVGGAVTTIWKALLNIATDAILLSRSPVIFKRAYRQGRLEVVRSGPGGADLRVSEWPLMSDFALRGMRVGIESTLRAAGRKNPRGTSVRTPDGALIKLEWLVR